MSKKAEVVFNKIASLEKKALLGPLVDLGWLGLPSAAGYFLGRSRGESIARNKGKGESSTAGAIARIAFIPGSIGYEIGKANAISEYMPKRSKK
jgi:hypothetical protein